jgi:hypothetical protein
MRYCCAARAWYFEPGNRPTTNCVFFLDTPTALPHNPPNFSTLLADGESHTAKGTGENRLRRERVFRSARGNGKVREVPCSIYRAGPFNASIRNVWRAASGSGWTKCIRSFAPIAGRRCTGCHRRWARGCECGRGLSVRTNPRAARGNRRRGKRPARREAGRIVFVRSPCSERLLKFKRPPNFRGPFDF